MPKPLDASFARDLQAVTRMRDRVAKDQRISPVLKQTLTAGIDLVFTSVSLADDDDIAAAALDKKFALLSSAVESFKAYLKDPHRQHNGSSGVHGGSNGHAEHVVNGHRVK